MSDLTRPDRGEAMERLMTTFQAIDPTDQATYLLILAALLAKEAPDVLVFLLDRADHIWEHT